jgi:predicted AAA+ superfamily ATPase
LLWGGYPEVILARGRQRRLDFLESYLATNLEKDVRDLVQVGDLAAFRQVYRMLAARTGEPADHAEIASVAGVSRDTVRRWHSVLEAAYQFVRLPAYSRNIGKRLVKSPRVYPVDVGLANYVNRQHDLPSLRNGPLYGKILEAFVIGELMKASATLSPSPELYYWRTGSGAEVDLVVETANGPVPLEVKAAVRVLPRDIKGLETFLTDHKNDSRKGYVICRTEEPYSVSRNVQAIPIHWLF